MKSDRRPRETNYSVSCKLHARPGRKRSARGKEEGEKEEMRMLQGEEIRKGDQIRGEEVKGRVKRKDYYAIEKSLK